MANVNNPRGFSVVNPIIRMREYVKGTAAAIYPGDAVGMRPDGKVYVAVTGSTTIAGVAQAYATAAATRVLLADHPDQQYYIKDDGVGGTLAQADIGAGFNIVVTAGNATFTKSAHALDTSTKNNATGATPIRLLGFHPSDEVGKYVRCRIRFVDANMLQTKAANI